MPKDMMDNGSQADESLAFLFDTFKQQSEATQTIYDHLKSTVASIAAATNNDALIEIRQDYEEDPETAYLLEIVLSGDKTGATIRLTRHHVVELIATQKAGRGIIGALCMRDNTILNVGSSDEVKYYDSKVKCGIDTLKLLSSHAEETVNRFLGLVLEVEGYKPGPTHKRGMKP